MFLAMFFFDGIKKRGGAPFVITFYCWPGLLPPGILLHTCHSRHKRLLSAFVLHLQLWRRQDIFLRTPRSSHTQMWWYISCINLANG